MIIFWGAGRIGQMAAEIWKELGMQIDYFVDNNLSLQGKNVYGIKVLSASQVETLLPYADFFLTCKETEDICRWLRQMGTDRFYICNTLTNICTCALNLGNIFRQTICWEEGAKISDQLILFDLTNGLVLGGVETWSIRSAETLLSLGFKPRLLVHADIEQQQQAPQEIIEFFSFKPDMSEWQKIDYLMKELLKYSGSTIICNFTGYIFVAACMIKRLYPGRIRLIAVAHNDEEAYYENYVQMHSCIDACLFISEKIKKRLIQRGFPKTKLIRLKWHIECSETFNHIYSIDDTALRIGYAGRIVIHQKRMDHLLELGKMVKEAGINVKIYVVGEGSFEKEMIKEVEQYNLQEVLCLIGKLPHEIMNDFWKNQDIMISCSDFEGHSITQVEAMGEGVVPIITNVSGAEDDVTDGLNGFIVEVGAVNHIFEKIFLLYKNRQLLSVMGRNAYETIKDKYSSSEADMWKQILSDLSQEQ